MRYYIETFFEVHEEDYYNGEGRYINSWQGFNIYNADTPEQALKQCLNDLDCNDHQVLMDGYISACNLVDEFNCTASDREIEEWKEGRKTLYSQHIAIFINELNPVNV